jgi:hypothetical protein
MPVGSRFRELVKQYFKRCPSLSELPPTLAELLRVIGITRADARMLTKDRPYYFGARLAQAWPKAFPSGQERPADVSHWNNQSKVFTKSLYLLKKGT